MALESRDHRDTRLTDEKAEAQKAYQVGQGHRISILGLPSPVTANGMAQVNRHLLSRSPEGVPCHQAAPSASLGEITENTRKLGSRGSSDLTKVRP